MKKIIIAVCVIFPAMVITAQPKNIYIGAKAGLNIVSLNVQNGVDYNSVPSFYAGGLIHAHITDHFAIQHELFFSGQGGKNGSNKTRLLYLNMPMLAQYMAGGGFRLETGPQLGFLLAAKEKIGNSETNFRDQLKPLDFSWAFGAGYLFPGTGLGVDARYNLGISNINDGSATIQNRVFSVGLFYQYQCTHAMKNRH